MAVIDDLQKIFKGAMVKADAPFWFTDFLRSGIPALDYALGGGFGYGRIAELIGLWASGKTMVLYKALAENQKNGGISILFEAEGAFDEKFYKALGGDPSSLWVYPLDTVEQFMDCLYTICETKSKAKDNKPYAVGWDSIAATGTKHLMETDMEDAKDMSKANAMSMGSMRVRTVVKEARVAVISTNQTREQIGSKDSAVHTPGGKAWPFIASQRVHLTFDGGDKGSKITDRDLKHDIGRWVEGKVIKNKLASPWNEFYLPIYTRDGFLHPVYNYATTIGPDLYESLFFSYVKSFIISPDKKDIILPAGEKTGRYRINPEVYPSDRTFFKKEWPDIVQQYPWLWTYPYSREIPKVESVIVQPTSEGAPTEQPAAA